MKFVCKNPECQKTFVYAATQTSDTIDPDSVIERHVCPYCLSLNFEEAVEPVPKFVSVVSVDLADVDAKLKEGYEVHELYAKTAVMIKKEVKE